MSTFHRTFLYAATAIAAMAVGCLVAHASDTLEEGFSCPPDTAKPWSYWVWSNDNLTKEGLRAELEDMKRRGIGGALTMDVAEGVPMGFTDLSPQYWAMVDFTLQEASRLGIKLGFLNSPSWGGSGGPWVIPEQAMQIVVTSETTVEGPAELKVVLPQPPIISVPLPLPAKTVKFYRDIAVLAFPTPLVDQIPFSEQVASVTTTGDQKVADVDVLFDHNPDTSMTLDPGAKPYLQFELKKPMTVRGLSLKLLRPIDQIVNIEVQASDDGTTFNKICDFPPPKNRKGQIVRNVTPYSERSDVRFDPVSAQFLRIVFDFYGGQNNTVAVADVDFHGGVRIADLAPKAGYICTPGSPFDPENVPLDLGTAIGKDKVLDLTKDLQADGTLNWNAPVGKWTIIRFGCTVINSTNQESPIAGRGLESDKLSYEASKAAWDNGFLKKVMDHAGLLCGKTLVQSHIDSYEEGCQNWTPAFRAEFAKRRHYDPLLFFPVLTGRIVESVPVSERFLWDYRRTLADLFDDNYYGGLAKYCHSRGLVASTEPYGNGNFDAFEAGGRVDIPMSEFWAGENFTGDNELDIKRPPSSAHTWGKPIVNAEAFTGQAYASKFLGHPYRLKSIGDFAWCQGVNRFVLSVHAAQPWTNPRLEPGMTMGPWGTEFGRTNTWWEMGSEWIRYVTRSQYLLQQGRFAADACVFEGQNDVPGYGPTSREELTPQIPSGYDYDLCDKNVVLTQMSVKDGRIVLPDGMNYRFLMLYQPPGETPTMTPVVLKKLQSLVAAGATLIGGRPALSPSLDNYPACDAQVKAMADELWGDCDGVKVKEHAFGKGKVIQGESFKEIAKNAELPPDFDYTCTNPKLKLGWIHRHDEGTDIYFVANQKMFPADVTCRFRVAGKQPEFWHSDTGKIEDDVEFKSSGQQTEVPIHFDAKGSVFVVFRRPALADPVVAVQAPAAAPKGNLTILKAVVHTDGRTADITQRLNSMVTNGTLDLEADQNFGAPWNARSLLDIEYSAGGRTTSERLFGFESVHLPLEDAYAADTPYQVKQTDQGLAALIESSDSYTFDFASGKTKTINVTVPEPLAVDGPWDLQFEPNRGAPDQLTLDKLISWSDSENPGVKYFSGTATYTKNFNVPAELITKDRRLYLDLGRVEVMADVTLNGKDLGILWKPPFRADITDAVKAGDNLLKIKVVNLWPNRLIGDEQLPDDCEWVQHSMGMRLKKWPDWLPNGVPNGQPRPSGRVAFVTWKHWHKDDPLLKSGLLGPVTIQAAEQRTLGL